MCFSDSKKNRPSYGTDDQPNAKFVHSQAQKEDFKSDSITLDDAEERNQRMRFATTINGPPKALDPFEMSRSERKKFDKRYPSNKWSQGHVPSGQMPVYLGGKIRDWSGSQLLTMKQPESRGWRITLVVSCVEMHSCRHNRILRETRMSCWKSRIPM